MAEQKSKDVWGQPQFMSYLRSTYFFQLSPAEVLAQYQVRDAILTAEGTVICASWRASHARSQPGAAGSQPVEANHKHDLRAALVRVLAGRDPRAFFPPFREALMARGHLSRNGRSTALQLRFGINASAYSVYSYGRALSMSCVAASCSGVLAAHGGAYIPVPADDLRVSCIEAHECAKMASMRSGTDLLRLWRQARIITGRAYALDFVWKRCRYHRVAVLAGELATDRWSMLQSLCPSLPFALVSCC